MKRDIEEALEHVAVLEEFFASRAMDERLDVSLEKQMPLATRLEEIKCALCNIAREEEHERR